MGATKSRAAYYRVYRAKKKAAKEAERLSRARVDLFGRVEAGEDVPPPAEVQPFPVPQPPPDAAAAVAAWCAAKLVVPDGILAGRPFVLEPWQVQWLRNALSDDVREAALCVARKNGKSGLVAALLLAFLVGPLHRPGWRGIVTSITGELAKELRHAVEALGSSADLPIDVRRSPTPGQVLAPNRARLDFLAADKATGHGVGADVVVLDEAGLLPESKRTLWNALLSCVSGRDGRMLSISILGDSPMFRELRDRADDPAIVWSEYSAPATARLDDEEAWRAANPGLGTIKSLRYMRDMSRRAIASPGDSASFRAYDLNLPQSPSRETICQPADWLACETQDLPPRDGRCVVGFDLGGSSSMTACAAIWPSTGRIEVWAALPAEPDLLERGRADGVGQLYERMQSAGELRLWPGRVTPVSQFLEASADRLDGEVVIAAGADRYRRAEAIQALTDADIRWPVVWRGGGSGATADGSHDVRAFQRLVLRHALRCWPSLLMVNAITESAVVRDARGNPALDKSRSRSRIDALSAAVIAAGLSEIETSRPPAEVKAVVV